MKNIGRKMSGSLVTFTTKVVIHDIITDFHFFIHPFNCKIKSRNT